MIVRVLITWVVLGAWCAPVRAQDDDVIPPPRSMRDMLRSVAGAGDFEGAWVTSLDGDEDGATLKLQSEECDAITVTLTWNADSGARFVTGGVLMRPGGNGIQGLERVEEGGASLLTYRYYWAGPPREYKTRAASFDGLTYVEVQSTLNLQLLLDRSGAGGESLSDAHRRIQERDAEVLGRVLERYYGSGIYDNLQRGSGGAAATGPGPGTGGWGGGGGGGSPGGGRSASEEEVVAAAAGIAVILIAAGLGVNVARAVAIALAEAAIAAGMTPAQAVQGVAQALAPEPPLIDDYGDEVYREGDGYRWGDRIVSREEAERLIAEQRARRQRQQAEAMAEHERFREESWDRLRHRSRQPDLEQMRRDQLTAVFDREGAAAERWLEQYDPSYLGRVDRLRGKVAAQGYATPEDVAAMRQLAGQAWGWLQNQNVRDQIDLNRMASTIRTTGQVAEDVGWEILKTGAAFAYPPGAFFSAAAIAAAQSAHRGDTMGQAAENMLWSGLFNSGEVALARRLGNRPVMTMFAGTATGGAEGFVRSRGDLEATAMGAGMGTMGGGMAALGIFRSNRMGGGRALPRVKADPLMEVHAPRAPRGRTTPDFEGPGGAPRPPTRPGYEAPGAPASRPRGDGPEISGGSGGRVDTPEEVGPMTAGSGGRGGPSNPPEAPGNLSGGRRPAPAGDGPPAPPARAGAAGPPARPQRSPDGLEMGGAPARGPANAQAAEAWQRAGADAHGHIYDRHGNRIARISPEGEITSLTGRPARITRDPAGNTVGFEEIDPGQGGTMREVEFDSRGQPHTSVPRDQSGEPRITARTRVDGEVMEIDHPLDMDRHRTPIHGEHMPRPARAPRFDNPQARAAAAGAGAGPRGEIFGSDGRVIGQVHLDGSMTAVVNGQRMAIVGHGMPRAGRVPWIRVRDGAGNLHTFRGDGTLTTPDAIRAEFGNTPGGRSLTPAQAADARAIAGEIDRLRARNTAATVQQSSIPNADDLPDAGWRERPPEVLPQEGYRPGGRPAPEVPPPPPQHQPTWGPRPDAGDLPDAGWRRHPPVIDPDTPELMADAGWRERPPEILPQEGYRPGGRPAPEVPPRPPREPTDPGALPRAEDLPDAVWRERPAEIPVSDVPRPPTQQRMAELASGTPLAREGIGNQLESLPQDAYFVQQRGRNDCVVACTAMAGREPYGDAAGRLASHRNTIQIGDQAPEALGVSSSRIRGALEASGLNPEGVLAATPRNGRVVDSIVERVGSGEKIVAHVSSQRHAVVIDRAWRATDGRPMARVLDPRGAAYEVDLSRADWQNVFDWKTSYFVGGA